MNAANFAAFASFAFLPALCLRMEDVVVVRAFGSAAGLWWLAFLPSAGVAPEPEGTPEPGRRGRTVELLALCFLVANTALVLFAWRAGDDFRATLDHVGDAVTSAVAEGQVRAASEVAAQLRAQVPASPAPTEVRVEVPVVPSPDLTATSLDLAREALDAGRFEEARRGLARLLANRDRAMLPEEMVLEARRLVALSYHLQGQALAREEQ